MLSSGLATGQGVGNHEVKQAADKKTSETQAERERRVIMRQHVSEKEIIRDHL